MLPTTPTSPTSPNLDDVFNDNKNTSATIVDADVIEAVKENIQPLQKGRRATALSAIFSTPHAQRDTILSRRRTQFRLQVVQALEDDDEGADPLDAYSRFVAWTLESYPQGQSAESGLLELLEEATRKLKDRESCKQDPRYLKLWILYAGYVDKPAIIYSYLLANDIGTDMAQLYFEYAYVLERDGRRREADEMYCLGIARKVNDLDQLKKRHADFQCRMLAAPATAPESPLPLPTQPSVVVRRAVLGESTSRPHRPLVASASDVFSAPQYNSRLQVFVDPAGEVNQPAEGNRWPDLGTRVSRVQENLPITHKMGDGPLRRSRGTQRSVSGPASRIVPFRDPPARDAFVPFRDEDETAMPPPAAPSRRIVSTSRLELHATPEPRFTPYMDERANETPPRATLVSTPMSHAPRIKHGDMTSEAEALRKDPFKNYDSGVDNI